MSPRTHQGVRWTKALLGVCVLQVLAGAVIHFWLKLHPWLCWVLAGTVMTFGVYAVDKLASIRGWRRMPEWTILVLILVGGFAGGWLGQLAVRHKTRKWQFWFMLFAATGVHFMVLWGFRAEW